MKQKDIRLEDDFYHFLNKEWLQKTKIPGDRSSTGSFYEIHVKNEKLLRKDTEELIKLLSKDKINDSIIKNYAIFARMTSDFVKREELGVTPLKNVLKKFDEINSIDDIISNYKYLTFHGYPLPFKFEIMQDFKNANDQIMSITSADLILPEKSYYDKKHPLKEKLIDSFKNMSNKLLSLFYSDKKKNESIVNEALAFDEGLVPYHPSAVEQANYVGLYNIFEINKINKMSKYIPFQKLSEELVDNQTVDKINVYYPKFIENIDKFFNQENFNNIKSWMILMTIIKYSHVLDESTRVLSGEFSRFLTGQSKPMAKDKAAFYLAYNYFSLPVGTLFAKKYFGQKAKKDVENMVSQMINIYKKRLEANDWLSQKTKEKAIIKLNALGVHVGYPTELQPYFKNYIIKDYEDNGDILSNIIGMDVALTKYHFSKYKKPINKNYWGMSPAAVNAYFHPFMNHIVFPSGILTEPFYSLKQSKSANFGGIGAVIAHEISHAFDNNGANFDENGNLNSWWTKEDYEAFKQKSLKMIELFDGEETEFGKCNGQLTVSENIADAGGISCALEASMKDKNHSSKDFFNNWAVVWRSKYKKELALNLLATDVHAPCVLRANVQLKNLDEFYKTFKINKEDKMFLPKDKRVKIW